MELCLEMTRHDKNQSVSEIWADKQKPNWKNKYSSTAQEKDKWYQEPKRINSYSLRQFSPQPSDKWGGKELDLEKL